MTPRNANEKSGTPGFSAGARRDLLTPLAVVAGAFCVIAALVLLAIHFLAPSHDPLQFEEMAAAKKALRQQPNSDALKEEVRRLDLQFRRQYFRKLQLDQTGAVLLIIGAALFVISINRAAAARRRPFLPTPVDADEGELQTFSKRNLRAVLAATGMLAMVLVVVGLTARPRLPLTSKGLASNASGPTVPAKEAAAALAEPLPSPDDFKKNWPRFRGPEGNGVAFWTNAPTRWDGATGEGVRWKATSPLPGFSSPVVWGDRLFLTGGTAERCEVYCFNTETGAMEWQRTLSPGSGEAPEVMEATGYAAPTPALDGQRVFAIFANGDLAAFTFEGRPLWTRRLGVPDNPYGHASSLVTYNQTLLVQFDQGHEPGNQSVLYAFDGATGEVEWKQQRPVPSSWATPLVVEPGGGAQLITLGEPWVLAYDLRDGREVWRVECLGTDVAPSPIYAGGLVIVSSPWRQTTAIRPNGQGDVTESHVAWSTMDNVPDITSPISNGDLAFTITTDGYLAAFDMKNGEMVWDASLDLEMNASPTLVGEVLYFFSTEGTAVRLAAARAYEELGRAELGEPIFASPAFGDGVIYVRGKENLFCLEESAHVPGAPLNL